MGDKIKLDERKRTCGMYGGAERRIQGFCGHTCGTRLITRLGCRWEYNIKMHHKGIGWDSMD